jgi:omega-6 fatty acid desaturase (delta-12 desaturase)
VGDGPGAGGGLVLELLRHGHDLFGGDFHLHLFVQHNYEGSYASGNEGWSYLQGSVAGSSNLELPRILHWFSADIAFHSIHHLCERIPNYRLRQCHERNAHLLQSVKRLRLGDIPSCFRYILWDSKDLRLISLAEANSHS